MPAALIAALPQLIQLVATLEPQAIAFYNKIVTALHKPAPTLDDWLLSFDTPNVDKLAAVKLPGEA